jgi:uncharacterized protein YidB (DUF937 family)
MSLFDDLAGQVMGKVIGGNQGGMAQIAIEMFNQYGGLNGVLDKFKQGGLGDLATSWVGAIAEMAAKVGITPEILSSQIAQHLPSVIDKMTPNGEVGADSGNLLSTISGMLK